MQERRPDNGKRPLPSGNTAGAALITVLGISLILMLAGITLVVLSSQSMFRIKRTVYTAEAQAVAEAGIADMVAKLGSNYTLWQNATHVSTFLSNGIYTVNSQLQSNGNVLITSDGMYLDASNRTIMELLGTVQTRWNEQYDINSAVLSDGLITLETGAYAMYGNVHANGDVNLANGTIDGDVSAGGTVSGSAGVTGTISNGAPLSPVPPNGPFNFDSYRQMATNNGTYQEGNQSLSGTPIASPANGILYVNGDLTIGNNSSFTGTIVVNGNVTIVNLFSQTNFPGSSNMPSVLSTGTITINNNTTLNGVVYAAGNVILQNNTTIYGGVIAGGFTDIRNSIEIHHGLGYPVWDPLNPEVPPEVIVGGWLK